MLRNERSLRFSLIALLSVGLLCYDAQAVTAANAYVTVSSSTYGVEDIVPVGADFYVTTRNVGKPSFRADISVRANSPYYLVIPANGRMNLGIGESGLYMVKDESGNEDVFSGRVYVLKLDIEPDETNVCWKASSCTLKLTDDSYPGSEAVWSSIPDGISGRGNSITFSPNALTAGEYTVTARSGIVTNYTDTCIVRIFRLLFETVSPIPINRNRTILGVGEEVNGAVVPSTADAIWSANCAASISPIRGSATCVAAPATAMVFTVNCVVRGISLSESFTTIEPSGVVDATIAGVYSMPVGSSGAGMKLHPIHIGPKTVSFYNVECVEVGKDAVNATGYWEVNPPPSHIGHGADMWFPLDYENKWPSTWDVAIITGIPAPWLGGGNFEWPIPAKWRVVGSGIEKDLCGWNQKFELMGDGTVTVRKFGKWVRRTTNNVNTYGGN